MRKIYLDNASTTKTDKDVVRAMSRCYRKYGWANASSLHSLGQKADKIVNDCRSEIASIINCRPENIIFTSGSTEGNNIVLQNCLMTSKDNNRKKIIISSIEHPSVRNVIHKLVNSGFEIVIAEVDQDGIVDIEKLKKNIDEKTLLVSIMMVNNEVGSLQPIYTIGKLCKEKNVVFHVDATQAINCAKINVKEFGVDCLTVSAHKFYGPKGVGFLYVSDVVKDEMQPIYFGGEQELGIRPGTYNVPGILGMTIAFKKTQADVNKIAKEYLRLQELAKYFWLLLVTKVGGVKLNGPGIMLYGQRNPAIINISFTGIGAESIFTMLDINGIEVGSGSACSGASLDPSYVLTSMGRDAERAREGVRFSFSKHTTKRDIKKTIKILKKIVEDIRG